jgi:hypothetical protein
VWPRRVRILAVVAAALGTGACEQNTRILVDVTWESGEPIPDLPLTALPFNPDLLLDSLTGLATDPAPTFPVLEAEMRTYERPDPDPYQEVNRPWLALRDTVAALSDSLMHRERTDPGYAADYDRFRQLYARLAERAAERDRALRAVNGDQVALARRAALAADSLRSWEYQVYGAYPELAAAAVVHSGRTVIEGTTDPDGRVVLEVEPGRWWLVGRAADPDNPFMEYYWNVPVTATRVVPVRLPVSTRNATWRWRH